MASGRQVPYSPGKTTVRVALHGKWALSLLHVPVSASTSFFEPVSLGDAFKYSVGRCCSSYGSVNGRQSSKGKMDDVLNASRTFWQLQLRRPSVVAFDLFFHRTPTETSDLSSDRHPTLMTYNQRTLSLLRRVSRNHETGSGRRRNGTPFSRSRKPRIGSTFS